MSNNEELWRAFFRNTPCDCDMRESAKYRCNLSGWIRCNRRLAAWRAEELRAAGRAPDKEATS